MLASTKLFLLAMLSLATFTISAQALNDECSTATSIAVNPDPVCDNTLQLHGSTAYSSASLQHSCYYAQADVWYSFVATASTHSLALTEVITPWGWPAYLGVELYSGECDNLQPFYCNFNNSNDIQYFGDLVVGETYYIRLYSHDGNDIEYNICVNTPPPPPANDDCSGAIALANNPECTTPYSGTTENATMSPSQSTLGVDDVWFSYTATETKQSITLSDITLLNNPQYSASAVVSVFSGDCNNLEATGDIRTFYQSGEMIVRNQVIGTTYFIRLHSESANVYRKLNYKICVKSLAPPVNDDCAGAITISPNPGVFCTSHFSGNLKSADPSPLGCDGGTDRDIWFKFVATGTAQRYSNDYYNFEFFSGDCDNLTSIACRYYYNPDKVVSGLIVGETYYIRVFSNTYYDFDGCLTTLPPPPANLSCAQSETIIPSLHPACSQQTTGTTAGVLSSSYSRCIGTSAGVWYQFTATHDVHILHIQSRQHLFGPDKFSVSFYENWGCDTMPPYTCFSEAGDYYLEHLTPGRSYFLHCASQWNSADSFQICIGSVVPPVNTDCDNAQTITPAPTAVCANNLEAIYYNVPESGADCSGQPVRSLWYKFTATSATHAVVLQRNSWDDYGFELYSGDCNNLVSQSCTNKYSRIMTGLTVGATYYIRVFGTTQAFFKFSLCVATLPAPPANDECTQATAITPVFNVFCEAPYLHGSTLGATSSQPNCAGTATHDVWYSFTATSITCSLTFVPDDMKQYFGGAYIPGIELYSGDCDHLTSVICKDESYEYTAYLHNLVPGQNYYLRVYSRENTGHDFSLCLTAYPIQPNDDCTQAIPVTPNAALACDLVYPASTRGAGFVAPASTPDVWFTFTATSNTHIISVAPSGISGLWFDLYRGSDCNNLSSPSRFNMEYDAYIDTFIPGETYYLRAYQANSSNDYHFNLCIKTAPPSPANETCAGAYELIPNTGQNCDLFLSGTTFGAINGTQTGNCHGGNDVWYKFVATSYSHTIEAFNIAQVLGEVWLSSGMELLETTDCDQFNVLACRENFHTPIVYNKFVPGNTYYVKVVSYQWFVNNYDLCIKTTPVPANDLCPNAQPLELSTDNNCTNLVNGTTIGAGTSNLPACNPDKNDVWYSFVASQSVHSISVQITPDGNWESHYCDLGIYTADCTDPQLITCWADVYDSGTMVVGDLVVGATYFVRIASVSSGTNFAVCVGTPPAPPANDACADAISIPVSPDKDCLFTVVGTTIHATPTPILGYVPNNPYIYSDVWYSFTATQANHTIKNYSPLDVYEQMGLVVYSGVCGAFSTVKEAYFYWQDSIVLTNLTIGETYHIAVYGADNFELCITSPQTPPNDECTAATPLVVEPSLMCQNPVWGSTRGATQSLPGCAGDVVNDIWFQFTATHAASRLKVALENNFNQYDNYFGMEILEGDCANATPYWGCGEYAYQYLDNLSNLVVGKTYYIRIFTKTNIQSDFSVCLTYLPDPPANNTCDQVIDIQAGSGIDCEQTYTGTTLGASASGMSCGGIPIQSVWYRFVATGTAYFIDLKNTGSPTSNAVGLGLKLYSGDDCQALAELRCFESTLYEPAIVHDLNPGTTYYIQVFTYTTQEQDFSLCIRTIPPVPDNSVCTGAIHVVPSFNLECSDPVAGTTAGLTEVTYDGCNSGVNLWYKFTATGTQHIIRLQDTVQQYYSGELSVEFLGGGCDYFYYRTCSDDLEIYTNYLTPGSEYYIRVIGANNSAVAFNLCVLTVVPPVNDACSNAITVQSNEGTDCTLVTPGSTLGATSEQQAEPDIWFTFTATSTTHAFELLNIQTELGHNGLFYIDLYSGNCDNLVLAHRFKSWEEAVAYQLHIGETYYISVFSMYAYGDALYDLCIKTLPPSPVNEDCMGALVLTPNIDVYCDIIIPGSTEGAVYLNNYPTPSCMYFLGDATDIWYQFTATSTDHQIQLLNLANIQGTTNIWAELLQSDDCENFTSLGCLDQVQYQTLNASALTIGKTYYLRVITGLGTVYQYDICITTSNPPANDLCPNAPELYPSPAMDCYYSVDGATLGATPSDPGLSACESQGNDVWYYFYATQSAHTILMNGYYAFNVELFTGDCGLLQHQDCRSGYGNISMTFGELTAGTLYFVRVSSTGVNSYFNICVLTPPEPPANDICANAAVLPVSPDETCVTPVQGSTEFATATPGMPEVSYGIINHDVWYAFTATASNHLISVNDVVPAYQYLKMEVYSGACGTNILVNEWSGYSGGSLLLTNLTPGLSYNVRVYDYYTPSDPMSFELCVTSLTPPANDECTNAVPLIVNPTLTCLFSTTGNGTGATPSIADCNGMPVNDIWYQFTATSASHRLNIEGNGIYSLGIEILEGNCGALTTFLPCAYSNPVREIIENLTIGSTYYVRIFFPGNIGVFNICLQELPPAPANDECVQALDMQVNSGIDCDIIYQGTTLGATYSVAGCGGEITHDVWYRFTATQATLLADLHITGTPFTPYSGGLGMEVYSGSDCSDLTSFYCYNYSDYAPVPLNDLIVGNTYFIRVFSIHNDAYDFTLCLRTPPPPPVNAVCAGAIQLIPSPDMQCTNPVSGTTAGLVWDEDVNNWATGTPLWYHFTATSNAHLIDLQNKVHLFGYNYTTIGLYEGDCDNLTFIQYSNNGRMISDNLIPGVTYWIKITPTLYSVMNFDICVLTVTSPSNLTCVDAVSLTVSPEDCQSPVQGVLLGGDFYSSAGGCSSVTSVWYKFKATYHTQFIKLNTLAWNNAFSGLNYELYAGDCDNLASLGCFPKPWEPFYTYFQPGNTYYLRVGSELSSVAQFDICVTTPLPDLSIFSYELPDPCEPGNDESVKIGIGNYSLKNIEPGGASFMVTITGANAGEYGPFYNQTTLYQNTYEDLFLSGLDLSASGTSQIKIKGTVLYDSDLTNNDLSLEFTSYSPIRYYTDSDEDGYGNPDQFFESCTPIEGYVTDYTDCDDTDSSIHPNAVEICNGIDDDCNGLMDGDDPGVQNTQPLFIDCPQNITVENSSGTCSSLVNYDVFVLDNCSATLTQDEGIASGEIFPVGVTTNRFTLSDLSGNNVSCSFAVEVKKSADPDLLYAYTVIAMNDVFMKANTVNNGGVGLVNANKKARLQLGTDMSSEQSFVKAPILEAQGGSQVNNYYSGQVPAALLPVFQANTAPTSNNLNIPANSNAVTLSLSSYGNIIIGAGTAVIFDGQSSVSIKELTLKAGAYLIFNQNTTLSIHKGMSLATNVTINPGGDKTVHCFAAENVTIGRGSQIFAHIYSKKDLLLEKASVATPTMMTGSFIAFNVYAPENIIWNWQENDCPYDENRPAHEEVEYREALQTETLAQGIKIAPNPASSEAQLSFELENAASVTVQLMDSRGLLIQTIPVEGTPGRNQISLQLNDLTEGLYVVQVCGQGYKGVGKLVVWRQ